MERGGPLSPTEGGAPPPTGTGILVPRETDALIFALPAWGALEASGRRIVAVVGKHLAPLAAGLPGVVEVVSDIAELDDRDDLTDCEEAVVLSRGPGDGVSRDLGRLRQLRRSGIPRRWGYGARGPAGLLLRFLLSPAVRPPLCSVLQARHHSEDFRELLEAMEVPRPMSWVPRLEISDEARRAARERLERGGIPADASPLVALIPGGRLVASPRERIPPASRWPWQRFAELARELRRKVAGLRCLLVAGREPLWPAVRVHEETARFVPLIGPDLDVSGLAALLSICDLAVAADGELLHLAAAVGTPTVALFGPTDPRRRAPRGERHRLLTAPGDDLRHLEPPTVLETALEILDASKRRLQPPEA